MADTCILHGSALRRKYHDALGTPLTYDPLLCCYFYSTFSYLSKNVSTNLLFLLFLGHSIFCSRVLLAGLQVVPEYISRCNSLANVTLGK